MREGKVRLDVALTMDSATLLLKGECAVAIIDVLRATSTITKAIDSGTSALFPVAGIEVARDTAAKLGDALLCGERMGIKPEGFDLGNTPLEFSEERVGGRRVVLASTNGTKALARYADSKALIAASLLNAGAAADFLIASGEDIILVCAGQDGTFGAEDAICTGLIIDRMKEAGLSFEMTDPGWAALTLYRACKHDIPGSVRQCDHAAYLIEEGFAEDVAYCSRVDILDSVPKATVIDGRLALRRA